MSGGGGIRLIKQITIIRDKEACGRLEGTLSSEADKDNSLMCYLMHFDPISSRIQSVFQPYFGQVQGSFKGSFFIEKTSIHL